MVFDLKSSIENFLNKQDKQSEKNLIKALKETEFLTAVFFVAPLAKESGEPVYESENFNFVSLEDGVSRYIPAFSDGSELSLWQDLGEHDILNTSLKEISLAIDDGIEGIVINPFSASLVLSKETLHKIFISDK